jgi:hypothetical protein
MNGNPWDERLARFCVLRWHEGQRKSLPKEALSKCMETDQPPKVNVYPFTTTVTWLSQAPLP